MKSYIKIVAADARNAEPILGKVVELTEKIDGSQLGFGKNSEGVLFMRSKGCIFEPGEADKLFRPAVDHIMSIADRIPNDTAFYCETLCSTRHNTLEYNRVPKNHLMLYGVTDFDRSKSKANSPQDYADWATLLEIEAVPVIYRGVLETIKSIADPALIDRESVLGGAKIEGVVVKQYDTPCEYNGMIFPFTALKYVSEQFKEKHSNNPDWKPQRDKMQDLLDSYATEARWHKAIQHLRDDGLLTSSPKDIGLLMKELSIDLETEEAENFKNELFAMFRKQWLGRATHGLPDFYKKYLLESV